LFQKQWAWRRARLLRDTQRNGDNLRRCFPDLPDKSESAALPPQPVLNRLRREK
jgi:hypothetical protein